MCIRFLNFVDSCLAVFMSSTTALQYATELKKTLATGLIYIDNRWAVIGFGL